MKSIIQEATSVIKAIEKAWYSAGQPKEFTIKVYEEPQKNFIGMTVKSAKIGIFFQEEIKKEERQIREPYKKKIKETPRAEQKTKKVAKPEEPAPSEPEFGKRVIWSDDMVQEAKNWIKQALAAMEKPNVRFSTDINNYYLRFVFDQPVAQTQEHERELFRSFSFLILQTLKRKFKRPLRGFKIVLTR